MEEETKEKNIPILLKTYALYLIPIISSFLSIKLKNFNVIFIILSLITVGSVPVIWLKLLFIPTDGNLGRLLRILNFIMPVLLIPCVLFAPDETILKKIMESFLMPMIFMILGGGIPMCCGPIL